MKEEDEEEQVKLIIRPHIGRMVISVNISQRLYTTIFVFVSRSRVHCYAESSPFFQAVDKLIVAITSIPYTHYAHTGIAWILDLGALSRCFIFRIWGSRRDGSREGLSPLLGDFFLSFCRLEIAHLMHF